MLMSLEMRRSLAHSRAAGPISSRNQISWTAVEIIRWVEAYSKVSWTLKRAFPKFGRTSGER
jgi:hypothetical protein